MRLFCFGLGYTGLALARHLRVQGWEVGGTCRGVEKQQALRRQGIKAYLFDQDLAANVLKTYRYILHSIPPDESGGDRVLERYGDRRLGDATWIGYLSTTGVYGDSAGAWVDETTALRPTGERQRRRLAIESQWLDLAQRFGLAVHIFRLAGIYGPQRNPIAALQAKTARRIDKPGHLTSRIHVDDLVAVLCASMGKPQQGGEVYNVCDDEPAPPHEVVAYASRLLGIEPPPLIPFDQADLSPMAKSFYLDTRRVSNQKIKQTLDVTLKFPTYRAGLEDILRYL